MKHHRSPTRVPLSIHATLALHHPHPSISTLLSPLKSIANTPPHGTDDAFDDFQSNAWVSAPSYHSPLAGLGITYLRDTPAIPRSQPLAPDDPSLMMQVDGDDGVLPWPSQTCGTDMPSFDLLAPTIPYGGFEYKENYRAIQRTPNLDPSLCDQPTSYLDLCFDGDVDRTASEIGLIPDVNMYDAQRRVDLVHPGVNPLDTICSAALHYVGVPYEDPTSLPVKDPHNNDIFPTADSRAEPSPSPRVIQDIMSILIQPTPESSFRSLSSTNSPSTQLISPLQTTAPRASVSMRLELTNIPDGEHHTIPAPCNLGYPTTTHPSPILNAHLGIELNELISRAERFRAKYPERDVDRAWLSHFAGKLSDRGELLNDFRCYVIGCDQRNKRRDHILVHVGAHIGQRPFACSMCPLRFLRKNECKRHEASHSGFRPYSCDICGQSFVRQDLVKRHVKRTHGLVDENEFGIAKQTRKRARLH